MKRALDALRWKARWHLKQRRPRPAYGDSAIDYLTAAANGVLLATAIIFTIGG